jgi:hypothetical protein
VKTVIQIAIGWFLGQWLWNLLHRSGQASAPAEGQAGSAAGGSGGSGGSGGPGDSGADYAALAAAIQALATGVALPNIQTWQGVVPAGPAQEIIAGVGGKRICVLAFSATCSGASTVRFSSEGIGLWQLALDAPAGKSGANLATAWPGYLFAGSAGGNLAVQTDQAASVSVTYWQEGV